jgi:hypothetical protein
MMGGGGKNKGKGFGVKGGVGGKFGKNNMGSVGGKAGKKSGKTGFGKPGNFVFEGVRVVVWDEPVEQSRSNYSCLLWRPPVGLKWPVRPQITFL